MLARSLIQTTVAGVPGGNRGLASPLVARAGGIHGSDPCTVCPQRSFGAMAPDQLMPVEQWCRDDSVYERVIALVIVITALTGPWLACLVQSGR